MINKIQAQGTSLTGTLTWFGGDGASSSTFAFANHRNKVGISIGGNFLYEDGGVLWRKFDLARYKTTIDVGSVSGGSCSIVRQTLIRAPGEEPATVSGGFQTNPWSRRPLERV